MAEFYNPWPDNLYYFWEDDFFRIVDRETSKKVCIPDGLKIQIYMPYHKSLFPLIRKVVQKITYKKTGKRGSRYYWVLENKLEKLREAIKQEKYEWLTNGKAPNKVEDAFFQACPEEFENAREILEKLEIVTKEKLGWKPERY